MRDQKGAKIGREFLVERKGFERPTWLPFDDLMHCKKVMKSYYNKHPELPFPSCLAENDDQQFEPNKKNTIRKAKQEQAFMKDDKKGFRQSQNQQFYKEAQFKFSEERKPMNQARSLSKGFKNAVSPEQKSPSSDIVVQGIYADAETGEITYHIFSSGKHSYQNRKWVMLNCKQQLIDFYERCVRIRDK